MRSVPRDRRPAQVLPCRSTPDSVHQGAALEVKPLDWGSLEDVCLSWRRAAPLVVLLDRVTDPHNVGAILRSAEVFGAPRRDRARPPFGARDRRAGQDRSGALERQPYLRVGNLSDAMEALQGHGLSCFLASTARPRRRACRHADRTRPVGSCWGPRGRACASIPAKPAIIWCVFPFAGEFGSLNVSNAAAVALYAAATR